MGRIKAQKSVKHILAIIGISLSLVFALMSDVFRDVKDVLNAEFIYRTGSGEWQDTIYQHQLKPSTDIAIIRIDEMSINTLQAGGNLKMLRIPKSVYIDLVEKLERAGVAGIAFDIIFQNEDPDEDRFAETLRKYDNIVIAASKSGETSCHKDASGSYMTCEGMPRSVYNGVPLGLIDVDSSAIKRTLGSNLLISKDHSYTLTPERVYSLPLALYSLTNREFPEFFENQTQVLNTYFGGDRSYRSYSLKNLLVSDNTFDRIFAPELQGKYVFIGESGTAIHDAVKAPTTGESMDGVELHAHFLDGILQNKILTGTSTNLMFFIIGVLVFGATVIYFFIPKFVSPVVVLISLFVIIWTTRYLYDIQRVLVDIFPIFLAVTTPYIVTYIYRFFVVDREKRELQSNFGHYIDPHVVEEIAERDEPIELGGERRELSVLFSDIAGFTTISEKLADQPQDLFYLMTSYLSNMTDILIHEGGTLDKYIGDAVMGFFGAPIAHPDHAVRACRTALFMRDRLPLFNADITAHGLEAIDFRVGIATGEVMVGNIGSHDRFNYTVLGDTVNLASRLEGTGKEYGVHIIISESVRAQVGLDFFVRELDTIAVKGKHEGVRIYELVGFDAKVSNREVYEKYEQALALYRAGKYHEAGDLWASQMEIDSPSRVMVERCMAIVRGEVMVENGIYRMTHK